MNILQTSLKSNAAFSLLSGFLLIVIHGKIAQLFGVSNATVFWVIGIGLVLFAATVYWESIKLRPLQVFSIIVQDLIWVIASIILLIFNPFQISFWGNVLIAVVALIVFIFALAQSSGLSKMDSVTQQGLKEVNFERIVKAPKNKVWEVISAVGDYHQVVPNLDQSNILSGTGEGMVRSCAIGKDSWTETCTWWKEGHSYAFEVDTQAPDYPFPLKFLKGFWEVESINEQESQIKLSFELIYKKPIYQLLIHPFMKVRFSKGCEQLLDNWQKMIEE